jgi:hypothetical protein
MWPAPPAPWRQTQRSSRQERREHACVWVGGHAGRQLPWQAALGAGGCACRCIPAGRSWSHTHRRVLPALPTLWLSRRCSPRSWTAWRWGSTRSSSTTAACWTRCSRSRGCRRRSSGECARTEQTSAAGGLNADRGAAARPSLSLSRPAAPAPVCAPAQSCSTAHTHTARRPPPSTHATITLPAGPSAPPSTSWTRRPGRRCGQRWWTKRACLATWQMPSASLWCCGASRTSCWNDSARRVSAPRLDCRTGQRPFLLFRQGGVRVWSLCVCYVSQPPLLGLGRRARSPCQARACPLLGHLP